MQQGFIYINGKIISQANASIGISDLGLTRGYGVFDFFRTVNFKPLYLHHHLQRFLHSAECMHLLLQLNEDELSKLIRELILVNNHLPNAGVKVLATGGYSGNGYTPAAPNLIISVHNLPKVSLENYSTGISVITHEYMRDMPHVKSTNYSKGIWLLPIIEAAKADDVIYISSGLVLETPRSNIFIVNEKQEVITPAEDILPGVTRRQVLKIAGSNFSTQERKVSINELMLANEVFITSTTKRILPVTKIDGRLIGSGKPGPVTKQLSDLLINFENDWIANH